MLGFLTLYGKQWLTSLDIRTHEKISPKFVGTPIEIVTGSMAVVDLLAIAEMEADASGLTHGGFTFGLADYAAMLAVNDPNVVLGFAQSRFLAPVKTGDKMRATATVVKIEGIKSEVNVDVSVGDRKVLTGTFQCYSLGKHVLLK